MTILKINDRVKHIKDDVMGTILSVDCDSYPWYEYGVTTVVVKWDDCEDEDIQWTNKLELID